MWLLSRVKKAGDITSHQFWEMGIGGKKLD
jgi:hypothetical protein